MNKIRFISVTILVVALAITGICDLCKSDYKTAILAFIFSIANVIIFFVK